MTRTRSEYRLELSDGLPAAGPSEGFVHEDAGSLDRESLAQHLLDAYRGTVDDEGETFEDALEVADHYLDVLLGGHSTTVWQEGSLVALALVIVVDGRHYIDPVATVAPLKGRGLGSEAVRRSIGSLHAAGVTEVGAAITDGNEPSERLFSRLGFRRVGPWPPTDPT